MLDFITDLIKGDIQQKHDKTMAQNSVSWRVEDAKRAGISPLAALGVQGFSASDVSGGGHGATSGLDQMMQRDIMKEKAKQEKLKTTMMERSLADSYEPKNPINRPPAEMDTPRITVPEVTRDQGKPMGKDKLGRPYYGYHYSGNRKIYHYNRTSGEGFEQEYGDVGGTPMGIANFLNDLIKNQQLLRHKYRNYNPTEGDFDN